MALSNAEHDFYLFAYMMELGIWKALFLDEWLKCKTHISWKSCIIRPIRWQLQNSRSVLHLMCQWEPMLIMGLMGLMVCLRCLKVHVAFNLYLMNGQGPQFLYNSIKPINILKQYKNYTFKPHFCTVLCQYWLHASKATRQHHIQTIKCLKPENERGWI